MTRPRIQAKAPATAKRSWVAETATLSLRAAETLVNLVRGLDRITITDKDRKSVV